MATTRSIDNVGFSAGTYGPPLNLGKAIDKTIEFTVSSRIWGLDKDGVSPKSYKVRANVAAMGRWVFLSVDECMHPMHALTRPKNTPEEKKAYADGASWYEYQWAKTDGVWKDNEMDAFPDRIYIEEMLPREILEVGKIASQHAIPIAEYKYTLDYLSGDKWYVNPGVEDTMGKLIITNTGEMEIWGNTDWEATKCTKHKNPDGSEKFDVKNEVIVTHAFQTHWPSKDYSKPGKQPADEDYYVGFHSFSLVFKLQSLSYGEEISYGYKEVKDVPIKGDKNNKSNKITKCGQDLEKLGNFLAENAKYDEETGQLVDTAEMTDYRNHLKYNRVRAYVYRSVDEIKKVVSDPTTRAKLLKELMELYPTESAGIITLADTQAAVADGGMYVVPNNNGMDAED